MTITAVFVLYAVCWFMTLFVILPLRLTTQNDIGEIAPGTAPSAPTDPRLKRKLRWTTGIATVIWAVLCAIILSDLITVADMDFFNRM
jgi:predicted secreted protein